MSFDSIMRSYGYQLENRESHKEFESMIIYIIGFHTHSIVPHQDLIKYKGKKANIDRV